MDLLLVWQVAARAVYLVATDKFLVFLLKLTFVYDIQIILVHVQVMVIDSQDYKLHDVKWYEIQREQQQRRKGG